MKSLLLIKDDNYIFHMLTDILQNSGYEYVIATCANPESTDFVTSLYSEVHEHDIGFVISIGFYPYVSLACEALKLIYISWILDDDSDNSYSFAVQNKCNRIYVADRTLYDRIHNYGNVYYHPLGYTIKPNTEATEEYNKDILIWSDTTNDTDSISTYMDDLKDSSKGYIDSMIEQRRDDMRSWNIYDLFAEYIKEDITNTYPMQTTSLEVLSWKYDRIYFHKIYSHTYAFPYIHYMFMPWEAEKSFSLVLDKEDDIAALGQERTTVDDIRSHGYEYIHIFKIIVYFPPSENKDKFTIDMWNIMVSKKFIMYPEWIHSELPTDIKRAVTFKNRRDLRRKVTYYLEHVSEREHIINECYQYALANGSLNKRINDLIAV